MDTSITRSAAAALTAAGEDTEVYAEECTFFANGGGVQAESDGGAVIVGVRARALMCGSLQALLRLSDLPHDKGLLSSPSVTDTASRGSGRAALSRFLCANR